MAHHSKICGVLMISCDVTRWMGIARIRNEKGSWQMAGRRYSDTSPPPNLFGFKG